MPASPKVSVHLNTGVPSEDETVNFRRVRDYFRWERMRDFHGDGTTLNAIQQYVARDVWIVDCWPLQSGVPAVDTPRVVLYDTFLFRHDPAQLPLRVSEVMAANGRKSPALMRRFLAGVLD